MRKYFQYQYQIKEIVTLQLFARLSRVSSSPSTCEQRERIFYPSIIYSHFSFKSTNIYFDERNNKKNRHRHHFDSPRPWSLKKIYSKSSRWLSFRHSTPRCPIIIIIREPWVIFSCNCLAFCIFQQSKDAEKKQQWKKRKTEKYRVSFIAQWASYPWQLCRRKWGWAVSLKKHEY